MAGVIARHVPELAALTVSRPSPPGSRAGAHGTPEAVGMSDRIHALTDGSAGRVHAYLLEDDDGLTLIDTLSADDGSEVLRALGRIGRGVTDLRRIVLTHAHRSHVRGAAWLQKASGATVYASPFEASIIAGERPSAPDRLLAPPPAPGLPPPGGAHPRLLRREGRQALTAPLRPEVRNRRRGAPRRLGRIAPGRPHPRPHRREHVFYWPAERALFTGTCWSPGRAWRSGGAGSPPTWSATGARCSELACVGDVEWIGTGHGAPGHPRRRRHRPPPAGRLTPRYAA